MNASDKLALFGGPRISQDPWPETNTIGEEEKKAVMEVLESGVLSGFRAVPGTDFFGGPRVLALEEKWANHFGSKHAISFNSLTSGLIAAIGAAGIGPGDEVIVSPFTMSASATCALMYGGVPVFADIDPQTYCMEPKSIEALVTPRTRAIVVVHIFGFPADMNSIMEIANKHNIVVIEDAAQAPAAKYKGHYVGTLGHIGGFSLNYHKTIHSGEGGIMVTDNDDLALKMQLIRNHGEVVVDHLQISDLANTFGGNTRMTEIEAAIAFEQLKKLEELTETRVRLAAKLDALIDSIPGITPQKKRNADDRHVYYFYPMHYDEKITGIKRERFVEAVNAEGIELREGYVRPIYWEPLFQKRKAYSKNRFPFVSEYYDNDINYDRGLCPNTEQAHSQNLIFGKFCRWPLTEKHMEEVANAFKKVISQADSLN